MSCILIGQPLAEALKMLRTSEVEPEVQYTVAPRYKECLPEHAILRVICVSKDRKRVIVAPFAVPEIKGPAESQD